MNKNVAGHAVPQVNEVRPAHPHRRVSGRVMPDNNGTMRKKIAQDT